jgi:hypothetical protein
MALRNQPYIPLYVQDVLTDEKLIECSANAHGVYFRLLCMLHKQETYGLICLKQKYKQTEGKVNCFADMLQKQMPFDLKTIVDALNELLIEGVLTLDGDTLFQKRMVRDGELSLTRAGIGKLGGNKNTISKQYGKSGTLYLMSDTQTKHKIGVSSNPLNRLYRLRSDLKLSKSFDVVSQVDVLDMGKSEDFAHEFFKDKWDGEWLIGEYEEIFNEFVLIKAKLQANL